jgi:SnoaL-like domain
METPDLQLRQELLDTKCKKFDEASNNNDAAARAAFFTEDAVLVTDSGPVYGREAIEKYFADLFKQYRHSNFIGRPDQHSPHTERPAMSCGVAGNRSPLFSRRPAILYHSRASGQKFMFVTAMLGRFGRRSGT